MYVSSAVEEILNIHIYRYVLMYYISLSISHAGSIDYLTDLIKNIPNSGSRLTLEWSKNCCLHEYRCMHYPEVTNHRQTNGPNVRHAVMKQICIATIGSSSFCLEKNIHNERKQAAKGKDIIPVNVSG